MLRNIFFDLDGTIIDSRKRLYILFNYLTGQAKLNFDEYWAYKRSKITNAQILEKNFHYLPDQVKEFTVQWMQLIEDEQYLVEDTLFADSILSLQQLSQHADLYLVTARQFPDRAEKQLKQLKIDTYFRKILVTGQKQRKAELIRSLKIDPAHSMMIGDTGEDTLAGKELNMITANVLTGFRNREVLETYSPDYIFNDLTSFCKALNKF